MVRSKLDEHRLSDAPTAGAASRRTTVELGPFGVELVHMSHSIPDVRGVLLETRAGLGVDDRRLQVRPDAGRRAPGGHLAARRDRNRGGRCCSAATRPTPTGPASRRRSRASARRFSQIIPACEGRIIVSSFASNIHRIQQVIDAAVELDRAGGAGRPLDAQELQHRLQPRHAPRRRPACSSSRGRSRTSPTRRWS